MSYAGLLSYMMYMPISVLGDGTMENELTTVIVQTGVPVLVFIVVAFFMFREIKSLRLEMKADNEKVHAELRQTRNELSAQITRVEVRVTRLEIRQARLEGVLIQDPRALFGVDDEDDAA